MSVYKTTSEYLYHRYFLVVGRYLKMSLEGNVKVRSLPLLDRILKGRSKLSK